MILQFDRPNVSNLEHESQALFTDHDSRSVSVSVVNTDSQFFPVYYYTTLYRYIRLHEKPIKYRKSHVDWRSIYINLWKRFFPFVSGAAMFHVPEEYRFTF